MTEPARDFMAPFLFRCPTTGMTVQDFVAHGDSDADIDLGMISLAKAAADPAGHYSRPDVTRLLLNKTPGDRVMLRTSKSIGDLETGDDQSVVAQRSDLTEATPQRRAA